MSNWADNIEGEKFIFDNYYGEVYFTKAPNTSSEYIGKYSHFGVEIDMERKEKVILVNKKRGNHETK